MYKIISISQYFYVIVGIAFIFRQSKKNIAYLNINLSTRLYQSGKACFRGSKDFLQEILDSRAKNSLVR